MLEATFVLFDLSRSMRAAAFPSDPASRDLSLAEAEHLSSLGDLGAISARAFAPLNHLTTSPGGGGGGGGGAAAGAELEGAAAALGTATGARVAQHRDLETKRLKASCHLLFPSSAAALAAAQRAARGELLVGGKPVRPEDYIPIGLLHPLSLRHPIACSTPLPCCHTPPGAADAAEGARIRGAAEGARR